MIAGTFGYYVLTPLIAASTAIRAVQLSDMINEVEYLNKSTVFINVDINSWIHLPKIYKVERGGGGGVFESKPSVGVK